MKTNGRNLDSYEKAYRLICKRMGISGLVSRKVPYKNEWGISGIGISFLLRSHVDFLHSATKLASKKDFVEFIAKQAAEDNIVIDLPDTYDAPIFFRLMRHQS